MLICANTCFLVGLEKVDVTEHDFHTDTNEIETSSIPILNQG